MRPRAIFFCLIIFALVLTGLAVRSGAILALALGFLVYLVEAVWSAPEAVNLSLRRELSADRVSPDRAVEVRLTVTNQGSSLAELFLNDPTPAGLSLVDGKTSLHTSLPAGSQIEWTYTIQGRRGDFFFNDVEATANDHSSLFQVENQLSFATRLIVQPRPTRLRHIPIRPPQTRGFAGPIPARMSGSGVDFFTVREYEAGDELRHINWKLSARAEADLITNIFEQERIADIGIILDARQPAYSQVGQGKMFESAVRAAADLSELFLNEGNRVGLLVYGAAIDRAFPGYGKVQRERILRLLARSAPGFNYALEKLDNLPARFFPARSQIIIISPLLPEDEKVLPHLCAQGYHVLLISPNPVIFDAQDQQQDWAGRMAFRLAMAERTLQINRLRRGGMQVADWDLSQPLDPLLQSVMARTPQGGRRA